MLAPMDQNSRAILYPGKAVEKFHLTRYAPAPALSPFVFRYWLIHWDLRDQPPHVQNTLPYPCVNLVFERDNSRVWGVDTGIFTRHLEGVGQVFGVKFKPGGFYPFLKSPVSALTDRSISLDAVFDVDPAAVDAALFALDDAAQVAYVDQFLLRFLPPPDSTVDLINAIVDCIIANPDITQVKDVLPHFGLSKRSMQRLFRQYVGVSPKRVIQSYRLQEAAEQVARSGELDWSALAVSLGYFDQAHFIKDFKSIIGKTPAEYLRALSARN